MNYNGYLKSKHWKETKDFLKNVKEKKCYICDSEDNLHTHHLHYKSLGYEDGNDLVYLCANHHKKLHFFGGDKEQKRGIETNRDLALACRKLQSMRSKLGKKLIIDNVSKLANECY